MCHPPQILHDFLLKIFLIFLSESIHVTAPPLQSHIQASICTGGTSTAPLKAPCFNFGLFLCHFTLCVFANFQSASMVHLHTNYTIHRDISQSSLSFHVFTSAWTSCGSVRELKRFDQWSLLYTKISAYMQGFFFLNVGKPAKKISSWLLSLCQYTSLPFWILWHVTFDVTKTPRNKGNSRKKSGGQWQYYSGYFLNLLHQTLS